MLNKKDIEKALLTMEEENIKLSESLCKKGSVLDFENLTRVQNGVTVWTEAFQKAFDENEIITIPAQDTPYYIDKSLIVPSNRRIEAEDGAVITQMEGIPYLLLRNEHTKDGTHAPIKADKRDENITIIGGRWEESYRERKGYRASGRYDESDDFFGVSTCFLFNNIKNLTLKNLTFAHTAGFSIQVGDAENIVAETIEFDSCYADGLHVNGNTSYLLARNLRGQVGDDLLALNMYDWQNSSVNFGPANMVYAENLDLYKDSQYKAFRLSLGVYYYDDGSSVDCSITNAVIKGVKGINTYKLYYQTAPYKIADKNPEKGGVGSGDNIYFEDIEIDLNKPVDDLPPYIEADSVRGDFAAFELGSNIKNLSLENIRLKMYKDKFPLSYFLTVGPKSVQSGEYEIFDPYASSKVQNLTLKDIVINGKTVTDFKDYIKEIAFDDLYKDGFSGGKGEIENIIVK